MKQAILFLTLTFFAVLTFGQTTPKTRLKDDPYNDFRNMAFSVTPEQLNAHLDNDNELYGVIMDWKVSHGMATVVAFKTGDASIYLSNGTLYIGGYAHENISKVAKKVILTAGKYLSMAKKTAVTTPTNEAKIDFYLLTKSGRYYLEDDVSSIRSGQSNLTDLFIVTNQLITEYRLITDK